VWRLSGCKHPEIRVGQDAERKQKQQETIRKRFEPAVENILIDMENRFGIEFDKDGENYFINREYVKDLYLLLILQECGK